jgi:hypothetical protein
MQLPVPHIDPSPGPSCDAMSTEQARRHRVLVPLLTRSHQRESIGQFGSVTQGTVERRTESQCPALGFQHPLSELEWRTVTNVLAMAARKLGHPVAFLVAVVAANRSLHDPNVSTSPTSKRKQPTVAEAGIWVRPIFSQASNKARRARFCACSHGLFAG